MIIVSEVSANPIEILAGQYYDDETGLHYNWHRTYDPATGRYLTVDPIGFLAGDVNLYRYVFSNPTNWTDSTGLATLVLPIPMPYIPPPSPAILLTASFATGWAIGTWVNDSFIDPWLWGKDIPGYEMAKRSKKSKKDRATDIPDWARYYPKDPKESCRKWAERILREKYGDDIRACKKGPGTEYNKLVKYCERSMR